MKRLLTSLLFLTCSLHLALGQLVRQAETLEMQLKSASPEKLAAIARERGNAKRGAILFYTSSAGCDSCHQPNNSVPLGPDLAKIGKVSDVHLIESLTHPSKFIREGFSSETILTDDGLTITGMLSEESPEEIRLRPLVDLERIVTIPKSDIVGRKQNSKSMMPEGLLSTLMEQRDFMDLVKYLLEITEGGPKVAKELYPAKESLLSTDDTANLDHAGIIKKLRSRDFEAGKGIFQGYCFGCHGRDGDHPSMQAARAFGIDQLKFGSDPYSMFKTLSFGNGLMSATRHLTPHERYQVIHYVREEFMKSKNPDYFEITDKYLEDLPTGERQGNERPKLTRNFKPALGSQLRRDFSSVLTIPLDDYTIAYNLHTMDPAAIWKGGFLDLSQTQHARDRGEGTANPKGLQLSNFQSWKWGHDEKIDYDKSDLLPRGPMPTDWMNYHGYYRHDDHVILHYDIDQRNILEMPRPSPHGLTQHLTIHGGNALKLRIAGGVDDSRTTADLWINDKQPQRVQLKDDILLHASSTAIPTDGKQSTVHCLIHGQTRGLTFEIDADQQIILSIPQEEKTRNLTITRFIVDSGNHDSVNLDVASEETLNLNELIKGGDALWPETLKTTGFLGLEKNGYAVDTLTLPDSNPWNTWFRTSALDFFSDGRMAVANYGGDIWIVSGVDQDLKSLQWKRFASGLYEPFGLRIVDDQIYVTCKDRLVRLHDFNADNEADYYESFAADPDVSVNFHAFNFDLQTDEEGNFYYAKSGHGSDSALPGTIYKISRDGQQRQVFSTGFRTPNGLGMMPGNRLVGSDNQGQWMPASKINLLKKNHFYGWVPNYSIPGMWEPDGGEIKINDIIPPTSFEPPIVWMPQEFDNSSGGQLWVSDKRFGPLSNHLLHTSFGKGWMSYLMTQQVEDTLQGAIVRLPLNFRTGVMRARVNPTDGQVYATGLQGWNGGGRVGLQDNGIQRLRYTGDETLTLIDCKVFTGRIQLRFNLPLDPETSSNPMSYLIHHWNYRWQKSYGSAQYRPSDGERGTESLSVKSALISEKNTCVTLNIPKLVPVDQLHLKMKFTQKGGLSFEEEVYWTIHQIPDSAR